LDESIVLNEEVGCNIITNPKIIVNAEQYIIINKYEKYLSPLSKINLFRELVEYDHGDKFDGKYDEKYCNKYIAEYVKRNKKHILDDALEDSETDVIFKEEIINDSFLHRTNTSTAYRLYFIFKQFYDGTIITNEKTHEQILKKYEDLYNDKYYVVFIKVELYLIHKKHTGFIKSDTLVERNEEVLKKYNVKVYDRIMASRKYREMKRRFLYKVYETQILECEDILDIKRPMSTKELLYNYTE